MPSALTKTYGPLPGWVWLAAIGGGLALSYFMSLQTGNGGPNRHGPAPRRPQDKRRRRGPRPPRRDAP